MTAESLFCWQLLGLPRQHPAESEAAEYLLEEMPGEGTYNLYYWYYATLSMYQLQDAHWQRWNDALRAAMLGRQVKQAGPAGRLLGHQRLLGQLRRPRLHHRSWPH